MGYKYPQEFVMGLFELPRGDKLGVLPLYWLDLFRNEGLGRKTLWKKHDWGFSPLISPQVLRRDFFAKFSIPKLKFGDKTEYPLEKWEQYAIFLVAIFDGGTF